jgi:hypothetical protein
VAQPEVQTTWLDVKNQADKVSEAVEGLTPPPSPNDSYAEAVYMLKANAEKLQHVATVEVRREYGEDEL